MILCYW